MHEIIDLRLMNAGVTCGEYSLLMIAGLEPQTVPPSVRARMTEHEVFCKYHNSRAFLESALDTPVTPTIEAAAVQIVAKYIMLDNGVPPNQK